MPNPAHLVRGVRQKETINTKLQPEISLFLRTKILETAVDIHVEHVSFWPNSATGDANCGRELTVLTNS